MSLIFNGGLACPIEEEIFLEERRYRKLFREEHEFAILKTIRIKIDQLKAQLLQQRLQVKRNSAKNANSFLHESN